MASPGLAPVVILLRGKEIARAAGGTPHEGDKLNLCSRSHQGRLQAYRVTGVEGWYGGVGPAADKGIRLGQTFVHVDEIPGPDPVPPTWLDSAPFAPVVLLRKDGVVVARTGRDAEPRQAQLVKVDSPHLGPLRAYHVLEIERWPANLDLDDEPVLSWGDVAVHVVEIEV